MTIAPERTRIRIELARGHEDIAAIQSRWSELEGQSITTDFDHFRTVLESESWMLEPLALTVFRDETPEAMVLARLEEPTLTFKIGYLKVYEPRVRSLTVVYRGFLAEVNEEASSLIVRKLAAVLDENKLDLVIFRRLDVEHPLYRAATTEPSFLVRQHHTRTATCWERTLPPSFDAFLGSLSKSTRSGVKYSTNKLERDFAGRIRMRKFTSPDELDEYFRDADSVAAKTYQRGLGAGVRDDESQRLRAQLAMERGWFRAYMLYVDEQPVAFCGGEGYKGRFYYGIPGYDPAFRDYRVGTYVLMKLIEDLCEDESIAVLDLGFGDAEYKRRFGDRSWHEADVYIFAGRIRPIWINVLRTTILLMGDALAAAARSVGVFRPIKQRWRRHAASHAEAE